MESEKKTFNQDLFIRRVAIISVCFICLIAAFMIIYSKVKKQPDTGFTGFLSIMETDEERILRQMGIMDPFVFNKNILPKDVSNEKKYQVAVDKIINGNNVEYISFTENMLELTVKEIFGDKKINNFPNKISYLGLDCEKKDSMYSCNRVKPIEEVGHYVFSSDVFTMNGRDITFTTTMLYYQVGDKYYTDSSKSTLICEGEVSCVYESSLYAPKEVSGNYYIADTGFMLKEIMVY